MFFLSAPTMNIRFKNWGFRDSANTESVQAPLVTEMQSVSQTSAPSSSAPSSSSVSSTAPAPATISSSPAGAAASPPAAGSGIWVEFGLQVLASQQRWTVGTEALSEMCRCSEQRPIPYDQDPLLWCKNNAPTFHPLSNLVVVAT